MPTFTTRVPIPTLTNANNEPVLGPCEVCSSSAMRYVIVANRLGQVLHEIALCTDCLDSFQFVQPTHTLIEMARSDPMEDQWAVRPKRRSYPAEWPGLDIQREIQHQVQMVHGGVRVEDDSFPDVEGLEAGSSVDDGLAQDS
jgi:hypothetical protein